MISERKLNYNEVRLLLRDYIRKDSRLGILVDNYINTGQLTSQAAQGIAPLVVTSTTQVNNLNAEFLAGHPIADFVLESELSGAITTDDLTEGTTNLFFTDERVDDRLAILVAPGSGLMTVYDDAGNSLGVFGYHAGLSGLGNDDHALYLLASDATNRTTFASRWTDLTDGGASTLHKHDHGGQDGLGDDDHTHYVLANGTRNITGDQTFEQDIVVQGSGVFTGDIRSTADVYARNLYGNGAGLTGLVTDHGVLTGLTDDDHAQYVLANGTRNITGDQTFEQDITVQGSGIVTGDIRTTGDIFATNIYGNIVTDGSIDHTALANLNSSTYTHLTATNHTDLTDAGDTTLHYHATDRVDANQTFTDVTTNNASTSGHGFMLKAVAPSAGIRNIPAIDNGETIYKVTALFDSTNPAALADTAAPGTSLIAARRDHVHIGQLTSAQVTDLTDGNASTLHKHDHGGMDGLSDDDHTIYALVSGTRSFTGDVTMGQDLFVTGSGVFTGDLRVTGDIYIDEIVTDNYTVTGSGVFGGDIRAGGDAYATNFYGNGAGLTGIVSDHGGLTGLTDDDHVMYAKADGTRAFAGDVTLNQDLIVSGSGLVTGDIRTSGDAYAVNFYGNGSGLTGINVAANLVVDRFTPNGTTTGFTLAQDPLSEENTWVYVDGTYQQKDTYTVSGRTLTTDAALPSGVVMEVISTRPINVANISNVAVDQYTPNGSTTDFVLSQDPLSENHTWVFLDGVYQMKSSYSVAGTTLSLDTAPPSGVVVEAVTATPLAIGTPSDGTVNEAKCTDGLLQTLTSQLFQARLTLESGVPVSTTDQSAKGTIYLTPYKGNLVGLYNGTKWNSYVLTEKSLTVPSGSNQMYDVFLYSNAGIPTLEALAWSNDTTRATALTTRDGIYVKSGDTTRRYCGSFRTITASQCSDTLAFRHLWNYYNRAKRPLKIIETTDNWNYGTAAWRQVNASAANQLDIVIGVSEDIIRIDANLHTSNTSVFPGVNAETGIGIDLTNANSATVTSVGMAIVGFEGVCMATYNGYVTPGRHIFTWLEYGSATGTHYFYGDDGTGATNLRQSGIIGEILG